MARVYITIYWSGRYTYDSVFFLSFVLSFRQAKKTKNRFDVGKNITTSYHNIFISCSFMRSGDAFMGFMGENIIHILY